MMEKRILCDASMMGRMLTRIAHEINERTEIEAVVLVGIKTRGLYLAKRLQEKLAAITQHQVPVEEVDIQFYRDDLVREYRDPKLTKSAFHEDLTGRLVVIVDDVLYTGRTVRAAMDAILDVSRPRMIRLAIMVDRGHRELPIRADFVGKNIPTSQEENIHVCLQEVDGIEEIAIT